MGLTSQPSSTFFKLQLQNRRRQMWCNLKLLSGVGAGLGLGIGTVYFKASPVEASQDIQRDQGQNFFYNCPYLKWDYNWDHNQRYKVVKGEKLLDGSKDSKSSRTIWLINDVQHYRDDDDLEQKPTSIGILQGKLCAAILLRLKQAGYKWDTAYHSTMLRTVFQAGAIEKALNDKDLAWKSTELLVEGIPVEVSPKSQDIPGGREYSQFYHKDQPRVEAVFKSIFYRPNQDQKKNTNDLVLTHPNIIRYFICRALQMPPEALSRFTLNHASVTKIRIEGNGFVTVEAIGDAGYMPPTLLTSGEIGGNPPVIVDPEESRLMQRKGFNIDMSISDEEFQRYLGNFEDHAKAAKTIP